MKTWVKIIDIFIILAVAAITFFAAYVVYIKPQEKPQVIIRGQDGEWTFPLNAEETIIVTGPIGETTIRLSKNNAWIEASPCENKNCVAAGSITKQGQWTSCLPNNVLLMIQGTSSGDASAGDNNVDSVAW